MNLTKLKDFELLANTKKLVEQEREVLTSVLHHLREVERRKVYSDPNCSSLYDYCVKILQYSEGQALRRIRAMRVLKEIPEIEEKIASGELNLSNISQAQSCFRKVAKIKPMATADKLEVLKRLENKSTREGQALLLQMLPEGAIPNDSEKRISHDHIQITLVLNDEVKQKLEEVRSLLGPQGVVMDYNELISYMASLSCEALKIKKFGKKRALAGTNDAALPSTSKVSGRYISKAIKHAVWMRDRGCCTRCGSAKNLNFDHIKPYALGGDSTLENIRLLCFNCNQRHSFKTFGVKRYTQNTQ